MVVLICILFHGCTLLSRYISKIITSFTINSTINAWRYFQNFTTNYTKSWRILWRNSVAKIICDGILSQKFVTIWKRSCREEVYFRFVTKTVSKSVTIFRHKPEINLLPWAFPPHCYGNLCQNFCHKPYLSVAIFVTNNFVTEKVRHKKLWRVKFHHNFSVTIVTDPSQLKLWPIELWRTVFRHNFHHKVRFSVTISIFFRDNVTFFR